MNSDGKAGAIVFTWIVVGCIVLFALPNIADSVSEDWIVLGIMGILALIGLGTTFILAVMTRTLTDSKTTDSAERPRSKPKNSDSALVDRLLATMSDDELASLRRRLTAGNAVALDDDGEIVTLEQALQKQRS